MNTLLRFLAIGLLSAVAGCCDSDQAGCPGLRAGQNIHAKLDGRLGMITWMSDSRPLMVVRFAGVEVTTDTHLLGSDGAVRVGPYADIYMSCFEVEAVKP